MTAEAFTAALRVELFRLDREVSVLSAKRASVAGLLALYETPTSAGPSTADPLPPLPTPREEGPTRAGEPEPEICETGEKYSDPIPWPVAATPKTGIPGAGEVEKIAYEPDEVATAAEAPLVASVEVASTASTTEEGADLDAAPSAPRDTQGGEEQATPIPAPAPAEQSGDQAGGEAPPAANVEPRLPKLPPLSEAHRARIWALYVSGWDAPEIVEKTGVSLSKVNAIVTNVAARAIWVPGRKVFWDGKRATKPLSEPEPDPEPIPEPVLSMPSTLRLAGPDELDEQGWSLRMDRELMHGRACGKSDGNIATKLGRKPPEIRARAAYLLADMGGTEAQAFKTLDLLLGQAVGQRRAAE